MEFFFLLVKSNEWKVDYRECFQITRNKVTLEERINSLRSVNMTVYIFYCLLVSKIRMCTATAVESGSVVLLS